MRSSLILGASGQVGQALKREIEGRGGAVEGTYLEHPLEGQDLFRLDLNDVAAVEREVLRRTPWAVYLPSGFTWVDGCETQVEKAYRLNAYAPEAAARACARLNIPFVFYSTDYVFGEYGGPYDELRAPNPLGVYGKSKLEGEERVMRAWPGALVLRTNVVYGPEPQGKNFIYQLRKNLSEGKAMKLPQDQVSNPTYNEDLASASVELALGRQTGIWNVGGPDYLDRYAFGRLAARIFGLDASLLSGVATADLKQPAKRPLRAGLLTGKLMKQLEWWSPWGAEAGLNAMKEAIGG